MKKSFQILLMIVIFGASSISFAGTLLTYDNFIYMNQEHQREYVEILQNFNAQLEADGFETSASFFETYPSLQKWTLLLNLIHNAEATNPQVTYISNTGVSSQLEANTNIKMPLADPKVCGNMGCAHNDDGTWSPYVVVKSWGPLPSTSHAPSTTPVKSAITPALASAPAAPKAATDAAATTPPAATNSTTQTAANPAPATSGNHPLEVPVTPKFRCIYSGFTILGSDCTPMKSFSYKNKDGSSTLFTCTNAPDPAEAGVKVVAANPVDPKKSTLCNPMLFGTIHDKPICIKGGKTATKDCKTLADKNPKSLDSAVALLKDHPIYYNIMVKTINKACSNDPDMDASLHLSAKGLADIKQTCVSYKDSFDRLATKYNATTGTAQGQQ